MVDLSLFLASSDWSRQRSRCADCGFRSSIQLTFDLYRAGPGHNVPRPVGKHRLEVLVPSLTSSPVFSAAWRSICAPRILLRVFEVEFLGDGDPIIADDRALDVILGNYDANGSGSNARSLTG